MIYILAAILGIIAARWLSWFALLAVCLFFAIVIGVEGAVHARSLVKVLKRGLEINATLQGAYLAQAFWLVYGPRILGRSGK